MQVRQRTGCIGGFPSNHDAGYADISKEPPHRVPSSHDMVKFKEISLDEVFEAEHVVTAVGDGCEKCLKAMS